MSGRESRPFKRRRGRKRAHLPDNPETPEAGRGESAPRPAPPAG